MSFRQYLAPIGLVLAIIVFGVMGEHYGGSKWFAAIAVFFGPFFFYRLFMMWERRERLKETYLMAEDSMRAIKAMQKAKKEGKWK
jgi:Na+/melibiose symporter-like transporter